MSDFVVPAAREVSQRVIDEAQDLRLSAEDQRTLAQAIADPSSPTEALVRSADAYRNLIKESR